MSSTQFQDNIKTSRSPSCEIITIGSELLLGQIIDTNTSYLAQELGRIGISIRFRTAVGDLMEEIVTVLQRAVERCDIVVTTGGLGPTRDDLTREAVAQASGSELEYRKELMEQVSEVFERNGFQMPENNRLQAYVPAGSYSIRNRIGTAPGFIKDVNHKPIICLPGVPRELRFLLKGEVIPVLRERFRLADQRVTYRVLKAVGLSESRLDSLIGDLIKPGQNPEVGLLASQGEIKIRLAVTADSGQDARALIKPVAEEIRSRLGKKIYGEDDDSLEGVVDLLLSRRDLTLAILETYSGGLAAQKLHGLLSSNLLESRVIRDEKRLDEWLGRDHKASDRKSAQAFAQKIREECGSDIGIAILGFPEKKETEYSLEYSTAIAGAGIVTKISRNMSGDIPMLMQRGIITCLDALRLELLNKSNG